MARPLTWSLLATPRACAPPVRPHLPAAGWVAPSADNRFNPETP